MSLNKFCVVFVTILFLYDIVDAKKPKKIKRIKPGEEDAAPQPDVVSYSTFGFNDVGTYEGFVPSSPDYARFLSATQETPANQQNDGYSTSVGSTGYSNSFGSSQPYSQSFAVTDNDHSQPTLVKYPQTAPSAYSDSTFSSNNGPFKDVAAEETAASNKEDFTAPVYGTKIGSKGRGKPFYQMNTTEANEVKIGHGSASSSGGNDKNYFGFQENKTPFDNKPTQNEFNHDYQQFNNFQQPYPSPSTDDFANAALPNSENGLKFPRVVDFTKFKSYYPELDTSQMPATQKPNLFGPPNDQHEPLDNASDNSKLFQPVNTFKDAFDQNRNEATPDRNAPKFNSYTAKDNAYNYDSDEVKVNHGLKSNSENKKKIKDNPRYSGNLNHNKWKDHFSSVKGYEFSTDYSNSSFKYDTEEPKRPFNSNFDEIVPAESNIDLPSYRFPDTDFSTFKKMPSYKVHEEDEFDNIPPYKEPFKQSKPDFDNINSFKETFKKLNPDFENLPSYKEAFKQVKPDFDSIPSYKETFKKLNPDFENLPSYKEAFKQVKPDFDSIPSYKETFKKLNPDFENLPSYKEALKQVKPDFPKYKPQTSSSYWGNVFPSSELSSYHSHPTKNFFDSVGNDDVVTIPKRPNKWNFEKIKDTKSNEWPQFNKRPTKNRPWKDWTKPTPTRYKSEEDLLDLRNQDTSHPSYLPTHQSNYVSDENDYKKLVDKWRQSYLKSKYRESLRDYDNYAETKPMHVAIPKPYPIEVPHPIIVPVPQPYPVRVPIAKPVAVPVIQELNIPIEKPVPYPVIKKVPYPIEKPVPVPVEKEVAVPVVKPYPVHVPYVRPVFHHTKTRDERDEYRHDDDYFPRHEESHKAPYRKKKPQSSRDRLRRPSRTVYHQERNRRRWPERHRPASFTATEPSRRPAYRHRDYEPESYGDDNEYYNYCRKTGKC